MINPQDPNVLRESTKNPVRNVAVVGLIDELGRILLVRTKRFPDHWQPIGGGIKPFDQSPAHTLCREIQEETGLQFDLSAFEPAITVDYDFGEGKVHFFVSRLSQSSPLMMNATELDAWEWFSIEDALKLQAFPATKKFLQHLIEHPERLG